MVARTQKKMGRRMKYIETLQAWRVIVRCKAPICNREIEPVSAFDEEQAKIIATEKATKRFGNKGDGWDRLEVHIMKTT